MQRTLPQLREAGYRVFAISYDPVEVLAEFADDRGIQYTLLSDVGSKTIERLRLLNRHVEQQQAFYGFDVTERHRGLPYPGTFVLDEQGVVVAKEFEQSYRVRPSSSYLLHQVGAETSARAYEARALGPGVTLRAWTTQTTYRPMEKSVVHIGMELADGLHVYAEPIPDGYVVSSFEIAPQDGVQTWPGQLPAGRPFTVEGLDEQFHVLEGSFQVSLPYKISGTRHQLDGRARPEPRPDDLVVLTVVARYQACTAAECFPPTERRLSIPLVEEALEP